MKRIAQSHLTISEIEAVKNIIDSRQREGWVFSSNDPNFVPQLCAVLGEELSSQLGSASLVAGRCVDRSRDKYAYSVHFDNYIKTTVILLEGEEDGPIWLAKGKMPAIFPGLLHLIPKFFFQNFLTKQLARRKKYRDKFFEKINLKLGDSVTFDGSKYLHFNEESKDLRISLIIHEQAVFPKVIQNIFEHYSSKWTGQSGRL